jgi:hypothetical protein
MIHILIHSWKFEGFLIYLKNFFLNIYFLIFFCNFLGVETKVQLALACLALTSIAKDCAEHHFHELSGKSFIPFCSQVLPTIFFYVVQILLRLPSLALLTVYLGDWFGLFLAALLPSNYVLASLTLKTLTAKNVWTGLMSTIAPICFVDKEKVRDHHSK